MFAKNLSFTNKFFICISVFLSACQASEVKIIKQPAALPAKHTITPTVTATSISSATLTPTSTLTVTATYTPTMAEPRGCQKPIDDYSMVSIHGMQINKRTYLMLQNAQELYGGELELTGYHLTQGSYTPFVSASFGTHDGGGAVDLSVIQYGTYKVLYDDIEPLIHALRVAGFAAWLRDFSQLYPGSPIHIHAIAIGDKDLSPAAQEQLIGKFGYFNGYNGIPQEESHIPVLDEYGGPLICRWMMDMGYSDLMKETPAP